VKHYLPLHRTPTVDLQAGTKGCRQMPVIYPKPVAERRTE
jgi:hypothetical protein